MGGVQTPLAETRVCTLVMMMICRLTIFGFKMFSSFDIHVWYSEGLSIFTVFFIFAAVGGDAVYKN